MNHDPKVIARKHWKLYIYKDHGGTQFSSCSCLCKIIHCMKRWILDHKITIYYIDIGCLRVVRADHGTENGLVVKCQIAFWMDHEYCLSGAKSFTYGPSTANLWVLCMAFLVADWWINLCQVCPAYLWTIDQNQTCLHYNKTLKILYFLELCWRGTIIFCPKLVPQCNIALLFLICRVH